MVLPAALALLVTLAVHPGIYSVLGITELNFEGCFETSYVEQYSWYYRINYPPLTWEACLAACNNRLTTHMGLRMVDSSSAFYYVYCGNGLPEISSEVENSKCLPCQNSMSRTCGGPDTMSVYKLRDNTPLAALLATDRGVEILEDNTTTLRVPYVDTSDYKHVDYLYTDDATFFVYNVSVLRSDFNYNVMKYTYVQKIIEEYSNLRSLAVDFTRREVYWGYWSSDIIYKTVLENMTHIKVAERNGYPYHFSLDAYSRLMFFVENRHPYIYRENINPDTITKFTVSHHIQHIYTLAIDTHQQLLYSFIRFRGDPVYHLVRWDYNVSGMVVLYSNVSSTPLAFDVFNNSALWVEEESQKYTVYSCKLTPRCLSEDLAAIYITSLRIYDLKIFNPERQTQGVRRLCANMSCFHGCRAVSPFTARCSCPPAHTLGPDNSTCFPDSRTTTQSSRPQTALYTSTEHTHSSTFPFTDGTTKDYHPVSIAIDKKYHETINHTITKLVHPTTGNDNGENFQIYLHFMHIVYTLLLLILIGITIILLIRYKKPSGDIVNEQTDPELQHCSNTIYDTIDDSNRCN